MPPTIEIAVDDVKNGKYNMVVRARANNIQFIYMIISLLCSASDPVRVYVYCSRAVLTSRGKSTENRIITQQCRNNGNTYTHVSTRTCNMVYGSDPSQRLRAKGYMCVVHNISICIYTHFMQFEGTSTSVCQAEARRWYTLEVRYLPKYLHIPHMRAPIYVHEWKKGFPDDSVICMCVCTRVLLL